MTISITPIGGGAPAVRWEPCTEFHDDLATEAPGLCAGCGWPPEDHELRAAA